MSKDRVAPPVAGGRAHHRGGSLARELALLAAIKLAVCALVLAAGFQGISDDDFARVVIAQDFAHAPRLDPSGTSWLPLPFWLNGGFMMLFGPSLTVARGVAVASGVVSVWLVRIAAGWLTQDRAAAFAGAAIAALMPWSARLGVSTVPELLTAACSLLAIASLSAGAPPRRRVLGALALFVATLSRYEPWFIALAFAAITLFDALRARKGRLLALASAAAAVVGPVAWTLWNRHAHGAPFRFVDRVTTYKQAVDQGAVGERVFSYVFATFRAEPELLIIVLYLAFQAWRHGKKPASSGAVIGPLRSFARPLAVLLVLFVLLTVSSVKGGAPTHHPERALLVLHLTLALVAGVLLVGAVRRRALGSPLVLLAFAALAIPAVVLTRSWFLFKESFASRSDEVQLGAEVARLVPPTERVLLEVTDYGFFAIEAGSRRPWSFVPSAQVDPAHGAPRFTLEELAARAQNDGLHFLAASRAESPPAALVALACHGPYCLYRVEPL